MVVWAFCLLLTSSVVIATTRSTDKSVPQPADPDAVIRLPENTQLLYAGPGPRHKYRAKVLFWTPCYDDPAKWLWWYRRSFVQGLCPDLARHCDFVIDKSELNSSDAVVFMVYGVSFNLSGDIGAQLPPHRRPDQRWIFLSLEPPTMIENLGNISVLNGYFNWTMSHRRDSDIYTPFGTVILTQKPLGQRADSWSRDYTAGKTKMAAWFVSHCDTEGGREDYVAQLSKYLTVDVYGRCGTLQCDPPMSDTCYQKLDAEYKFYLAFENILCKDYVTEKFLKALAKDVVPVVFGGADYSRYAPSGSYIDAMDFPDPKALAEHLIRLDGNAVEYNRFFDWKRGYEVKVVEHAVHVCNLCAKVLETELPAKTYDNIDDWWRGQSECRPRWTPAANNSWI